MKTYDEMYKALAVLMQNYNGVMDTTDEFPKILDSLSNQVNGSPSLIRELILLVVEGSQELGVTFGEWLLEEE